MDVFECCEGESKRKGRVHRKITGEAGRKFRFGTLTDHSIPLFSCPITVVMHLYQRNFNSLDTAGENRWLSEEWFNKDRSPVIEVAGHEGRSEDAIEGTVEVNMYSTLPCMSEARARVDGGDYMSPRHGSED